MSQVVPSYMLKVGRAEKHLVDLKVEVDRYADRHPYTVASTRYRRRKEYRLRFTEDPINTKIGLILADLVHNLTSGLDHLVADMVPPKDRSHVMFPVFWEGVWDDPVPGENEQRTKDRGRWKTITRNMNDLGVALLQKMQPPAVIPDEDEVPVLLALHRLSNTDKHSNLPIMSTGLRNAEVFWTDRNGDPRSGKDPRTFNGQAVVENNAVINVPNGAVDVKVKGTAVVAVGVTEPARQIEIPDMMEKGIVAVRELVMAPLMNFLYAP